MDERTQVSEPQVEETVEGQSAEPVEPIEETDEFKDWDKDKSVKAYQNLQKKITEREKRAKSAEEKALRLEERTRLLEEQLQNFSQPQREEAPKRPAPLPSRPKDFSMEDIYDKSTTSHQWWMQKLDYDEQLSRYLDYKDQRDVQERQKRAEAEKAQLKFQETKNDWVRRFQDEGGGTLQEAMEAFDFITSPDSAEPKNVIEYRRWKAQQKSKPNIPKPQSTPSATTVNAGQEEQVNRQQFTRSTDANWMYQIKK